jgi:hypothetical protein
VTRQLAGQLRNLGLISWWGTRCFSLSKAFRPAGIIPKPHTERVLVVFSPWLSGRVVELTTNIHLALRWTINSAINPSSCRGFFPRQLWHTRSSSHLSNEERGLSLYGLRRPKREAIQVYLVLCFRKYLFLSMCLIKRKDEIIFLYTRTYVGCALKNCESYTEIHV